MSDKIRKHFEIDSEILEKFEENMPRTESSSQVPTRLAPSMGDYPAPNLAVGICDRSLVKTINELLAKGKSQKVAMHLGKLAFCGAIPTLTGATNIRDFIACVTYGMSLDIIPGREGTRLLYAAQLAYAALKKEPHKRRRSSKIDTVQKPATSAKAEA